MTTRKRPAPFPEDTTHLGGTNPAHSPVKSHLTDTKPAKAAAAQPWDIERTSIPVQIERLSRSVKRNLYRIHGLVAKGDLWEAAEVIRKFAGPQIGTTRALVDRLNQLEPGHITDPLLSTHIPPRIKVKRKQYKMWSEK